MTQEEREEEAALAREYEEMRANGVSLKEIGAGRAKGVEDTSHQEWQEKRQDSEAITRIEDA